MTSTWARVVCTAVVVAGGVAGAPAPASALECQRDADCPGDLICDGGRCLRQDGSEPSPAELGGAGPAAGAPAAAPAAPVAAPGAPAGAATSANAKVSFYSEVPGHVDRVTHLATGASCNTPCALMVPPGNQDFQIVGPDGDMTPTAIGLEQGEQRSYEIVHFNGGQFAVGLTMFLVGIPVCAGGIVLTATEEIEPAPGITMAALGGVTFIAGEFLFLLATSRIAEDDRPPLQVGVAPAPGGASGAVRLEF